MPCISANTTTASSPQNRWLYVLAVLVVGITATVLGSVVHHDFVAWDDDLHVYANPRFQPVTWHAIAAFWRAPYQYLYIPLTYTVWAAIAWVTQMLTDGRLIAGPFHRLNLLLHLGSVLVVYRLGLLVLCRGKAPLDGRTAAAAALGAVVFGVHPLQVEAVAWVSGLKDVLWGWWALVALWQYLEYAQAPRRRRQIIHYGVATGAFVLALLAKPAAVVVPVVAWVLDTGGLGRSWRHAIRALGVWLVVAGVWSVWTKVGQPDLLLGHVPPWSSRIAIAADAVAFYLGKLVWPAALGPDYGRTPQVVLGHAWGASLAPVGLGVIFWYNRRKWPGLWLGAAIFVAALLPVMGVVPFAFQAYSTVADRYVYVALLGPALGLAWVMLQTGHRWPAWVFGVLVLGALAGRSADQVPVWRDTVSLFTHGLWVNPGSSLAHNNLGLAVAQQGALDEAMSHFQTALASKPDSPEAHYNLGMAFTLKQAFDKAITHYSLALRLRPNWAEAHNNLGIALESQGKFAEALANYAQALLSKPGWAQAYYNVGNVLSKQGRPEEAAMAYRTALRKRPSWTMPAISLARLLATQEPSSPDAVAEAVRLAENACRTTGYQDATALYTLALAYQAAGRPEAAWPTAHRALSRANAAGHRALVVQITTHFPLISQPEPNHVWP